MLHTDMDRVPRVVGSTIIAGGYNRPHELVMDEGLIVSYWRIDYELLYWVVVHAMHRSWHISKSMLATWNRDLIYTCVYDIGGSMLS